MSKKNKLGKALSTVLSISMLFGMSLSAVKAEDIVVVSQDFENVASATDAGWSWNVYKPTIEANVGDNATNALKLGPNDDAGSEIKYQFSPRNRFTLKMKLYMENMTDGTYIRFINANKQEFKIVSYGWGKQIWQENAKQLKDYTPGWNDVEMTVDPAQKTYSFKINDITVAETSITQKAHNGFFDSAITTFSIVKGTTTATVAIDDFSITQYGTDIDTNFNSLSATDLAICASNDKWCLLNANTNTYLSAYANCATISMSGGIADKAAEDKCVVIKGDNIDTSNGTDPFVKFTSSTADSSLTTLDFKLYMEGNCSAYIQPIYGDNKSLGNIIFWNSNGGSDDGTVWFGGTQLGDFNWKTETETSKWMNVSIAVDDVLNTTTVIINNKIVGQIPNAASISGYKFISMYSADGQSGTLAIDDLKFYEGIPEGLPFKTDIQTGGTSCTVTVSTAYDNSLHLMLIVAEYDSEGRFVDAAFKNTTVSGSTTDTLTKTLKDASNTVKAFAWNPDNFKAYTQN